MVQQWSSNGPAMVQLMLSAPHILWLLLFFLQYSLAVQSGLVTLLSLLAGWQDIVDAGIFIWPH
jgi:hypothetical protein